MKNNQTTTEGNTISIELLLYLPFKDRLRICLGLLFLNRMKFAVETKVMLQKLKEVLAHSQEDREGKDK